MNIPTSLRSPRTYWIVTAIMSLFMASGALFDLAKTHDAVVLIRGLGYPEYFIRFIGVMRLLGVAAVLVRGLPRLKQWAYAGLMFDTGGALFSHFNAHSAASKWFPALIGVVLVAASYGMYTTTIGPFRLRASSSS